MADIRTVRDMNGLITYFSENLGWEIDLNSFDDIEDISYEFEAQDIGLKDEAFAKIASMRQLQPMVNDQQWGIFCIEFESHRFEPTALRKILSGLVPRRRASVDHAMWQQQDLLFICNWGEGSNRTIGLAHFEDKERGLPQIKMISCDPSVEDFTQIKQFEDSLKQLSWPGDPANMQAWRDQWSNAFSVAYREVIQTSSMLTIRLAAEAQNIRNLVLDVLKVENEQGYVHKLYEKFRQALIHDMTETAFADMYAQTVVYGLFSARCMDKTQDDFSVREAVTCIPNTNPFLRELMKECLGADSRDGDFIGADKRLYASFDELDIGNVVDLLAHTNTDAIIRDFNRQTGGGKEDPIIHFYEEFLTAYDKQQKVQRGVFYTPQPVVSFMVRAVDDILKKEFGYEDGLASIETKSVEITRKSKKKNDRGFYYDMKDAEEVPAVQVLDPATGTGTFLRQIILQIYENFEAKHAGESDAAIKAAWNEYVPKHLLPRINGFELMMAPYAVAHMKLAMVLHDTGYEFGTDARLNVCLTNTLEPPGDADDQISFFSDPLAMESIEANKVKKNDGINVIIGNPPYNVSSSNCGDFILQLISEYKKQLNEKKINLDDDYIKFIRYGEHLISNRSSGILAYISNNSFLDGVTHREMRRHLESVFDKIYIINLHGNVRKREVAPNGSKDENVFDIMQGVSINIFISTGKTKNKCEVYSCDLYGDRPSKYSILNNFSLEVVPFTKLDPIEPYFFFTVKEFSNSKYEEGISIKELFPVYNSGIQTKRDKITVSFTPHETKKILQDLLSMDHEEFREKYELPEDGRDWTIQSAYDDVKNNNPQIIQYLYRPYDIRYSAYTGVTKGFIGYPRASVMNSFMNNNLGLLTTRNHSAPTFEHVFVANRISDIHSVSDQTYVFPLLLYSRKGSLTEQSFTINICEDIAKRLLKYLSYKYDGSIEAAIKVFSYVYGVLHSKRYREENNEYLKIDFPKIPLPLNDEEFCEMAKCGKELIDCHLFTGMTSEELTIVGTDMCISKVAWKDDKIYINKTTCINKIWQKDWEYKIGSYYPLQHWLKDRKGKVLSDEDINMLGKMIRSIRRSLDIIDRINQIQY